MSAFDKVVAEWLNGVGETLPPATKQDILTGIKENIERYKAMDDTICTTPATTGAADDDKQGEASAAEQDSRVANVSDEQQQQQQQQSAPCAAAETTTAAVSADTNRDESATSANEVGRVLDGITHDTLHETAEEKAADDAIPPAATDAAAEAAQAADDAAQDNSADVAAAGDVCAHDESNDDSNKDDNEDAAAAAAVVGADDDHCHPHAHAAHHHVDPHADKEATTPTHEATTTAATTTTATGAAAPHGTAAHTRTAAAAATTSSATRRTAHTSQQQPQSHHLPSLFTIDTSNIDYAFEESVEVALRRLEAGKTTAPLFGPEPDEDAAAACAVPPAAPRDADDTETTTAAHSGTRHEEGDVDDNSSQRQHEDEAQAHASRSRSGSRRASHHDDEEAVTLSATADDSTCAKVAAMQGFVFGRASDEAHGEGAQLHRAEHDAPSSSSAAAADADVALHDHDQHTRGSADVIDETEDERRRRAQLEHSNPRIGVSDEPLNIARAMATHFPTSPKSQEQFVVLTRALEHHFLFSSLDDDDIARCAAIMPVREYAAGTAVLTRGSANDVLHLILEGTAEATVPRGSSNSSSSSSHLEQQQGEAHDDAAAVSPTHETLQLSRGNTFGDLGVLYECVNNMDVRATTPLRCATIDRTTYKLFVSRAAEERRTRYAALLQRVPFLSAFPQHDLLRVAEALKEACYAQGDKIIEHGSTNQWLHLVVEGSVDVVGRNDAGAPTHIATLHAGDHAGHLECLYHHVAVADVVAATPRVRTAKLSRRQFDRLIDHSSRGPLQRDVEEDGSYAYYRATMHSASRPREDTSPAFDEPPCYLARALHDHEERAHSLEAQQPQSQVASDAAHDVATAHGDDVDEAVVAAAAEAAEAAVAAAQDERDVACRDEL